MAVPTVRRSGDSYDGAVNQVRPGRAARYTTGTVIRTLCAVTCVAVLASPILALVFVPGQDAASVGALLVLGLALTGVGLPVVAGVLASADWRAASSVMDRHPSGGPVPRAREPRSLVRPLAYSAVMLTAGAAVSVLLMLLVVGSLVGLSGPALVAVGDEAVIGPITVHTTAQSVVAALVSVLVLTLCVAAAPTLTRFHAMLVVQVLTRPEQELEQDLAETSRSRTRLVQAFDVERRRIERDLHDGVQPQILSVSMTLGLALAELPEDAPGRDDVRHAQDQARTALESLRRFVHNIHPQVLVDHGLGAAVRELADSLTLQVSTDDRLDDRLPVDIESTLYFCVAELLANVVKHSDADRVNVTLRKTGSAEIGVAVTDNGIGGATIRHNGGGLDGLRDRVSAYGGTFTLVSPPGGPTTATVTLREDHHD